MTVQVQQRPAVADHREYRLAARLLVAGLDQLVADRQRVQLGADALDALVIGGARRILRGNRDQVAGELQQAHGASFAHSRAGLHLAR